MTGSRLRSDQIDVVCAPSPTQIDALAGERSPLIFDLRQCRDRVLSEMQPAYVWLRPMDGRGTGTGGSDDPLRSQGDGHLGLGWTGERARGLVDRRSGVCRARGRGDAERGRTTTGKRT